MYLLLITNHYQIVEGILLSSGKGTIRVAARGFTDTLELNQVADGRWMHYQSGRTFEIAGLTIDPEASGAFAGIQAPPAVAMAAGAGSAEMWN